MALTPTRLVAVKHAVANTAADVYTAPAAGTAARVIVKQVTISSGAVAPTVSLVLETGAGAANAFPLIDARVMEPNDTLVLDLSLVLNPGEMLNFNSSVVGTCLTASGLVDLVTA